MKTCVRRFTIEEITRGKNRKEFHYVGSRKKLKTPKEVVRVDKDSGVETEYSVHYETVVRKAQ